MGVVSRSCPEDQHSFSPQKKMKFFVLLTLAAVGLADYESKEMMSKWMQMKAMESCWGAETMKQYTVEMKKAIAKCSNEDAPELSLPPYRSSYRFVNAMINNGNSMDMLKNMMTAMSMSMNQDNSEFSYVQPYSTNSGKSDSFMDKMKMMMMKMKMKDMMRSNYQDDYDMSEFFKSMRSSDRMDNYRTGSYKKNDPMSQFKQMFNSYRSKRQASRRPQQSSRRTQPSDNLDLGDRLVEKLAEQKRHMEQNIGNMTCVLKETNALDASNNLDIQAMKRDMQQYTMPSPWFGQKYEQILETCYEMATNLPREIADNSVVSGSFGTIKLGEIKMFMKCEMRSKMKLCMNQDIKNKVESNFGPMQSILQQTQLTEAEFFPLVMQLLHGEEIDYMTGSM